MNKHLCECGQEAVWCLMSGYGYYCDNCVLRGCTCNNRYVQEDGKYCGMEGEEGFPEDATSWKWLEEGKIWCSVDEQGREWPCCEYDYDKEGYEKLIT